MESILASMLEYNEGLRNYPEFRGYEDIQIDRILQLPENVKRISAISAVKNGWHLSITRQGDGYVFSARWHGACTPIYEIVRSTALDVIRELDFENFRCQEVQNF